MCRKCVKWDFIVAFKAINIGEPSILFALLYLQNKNTPPNIYTGCVCINVMDGPLEGGMAHRRRGRWKALYVTFKSTALKRLLQ